MKATQSKSGLGRFVFLIAALAALMALPAASASAAETPRVKVNMEGAGSGEVTSDSENPGAPPMACSWDGITASGVCENVPGEPEVPGYFSEVLIANPAPGSKFTGWSVEGGPAECFTAKVCVLFNYEANEGIEWEVYANFELIPLTLNLNVNGPSGSGSVTSAPSGINCSATESCSGEFEGPVTLTASPASGYAVAGWIGCKQASTSTCTVAAKEDNEEVDATAIFVKEGTQGTQGPQGAQGTTGDQGATGPAGVDGAAGPQGAIGPQGLAGPQGPEGKRGPAGKVKVVCKVKGSKKVKCVVKQSKSSKRRLRWSLHRSGHTLSHGRTNAGKLQRVLNHLPSGRYSLRVAGRSKDMAIEIN